MKYEEVLDRIKNLDKSEIIMTDGFTKSYSKISLKYQGVRIMDLTRPQFEKLKKLGYEWEVVVY
jgi:hypothetical protein